MSAEGLSGIAEFAAVMNGLADAVTVRIGRKAVDEACKVTQSWVNARTPRGENHALANAVAHVVHVYIDDNRVAGFVGFDMDAPAPPRKHGMVDGKEAESSKPPFLYGSWVDQGHYVRNKQTGKFKTRKGGIRTGIHQVVPPHPFFAAAVEMATPQAMETMRKAYAEGIAAELRRAAKPS